MPESRSFSGVTIELVHRIKHDAHKKHGVIFDPIEGTAGTATGRTPFGDCVVSFVYDSAKSLLVLTLQRRPMLLPAVLLWHGFKAEIDRLSKLV